MADRHCTPEDAFHTARLSASSTRRLGVARVLADSDSAQVAMSACVPPAGWPDPPLGAARRGDPVA